MFLLRPAMKDFIQNLCSALARLQGPFTGRKIHFSPPRALLFSPSAQERRGGAFTVAGSAKLLGAKNGAFGPTAHPRGTRREGDGDRDGDGSPKDKIYSE